MRLFWQHGYEATSLAMLRDEMGLTQPQIYNAFSDKETLFRLAVERYHANELAFAAEALTAPVSTPEAMRRLLIGAAEFYTDPGKPGGCLFFSAALAASPQAQPVALELRERRAANESAIATRLHQGQLAGDVPPELAASAAAKYISSVMTGMSLQARDGASTAELCALAETALLALPIGR